MPSNRLQNNGISYFEHFLDDFIIAGSPLDDCKHNLSLLENLFSLLLNVEKQEGLAIRLIFLGIELDTANLELRLPAQ